MSRYRNRDRKTVGERAQEWRLGMDNPQPAFRPMCRPAPPVEEKTAAHIYEENADLLASARTKWLMGEGKEALNLYEQAALQYDKYKSILKTVPGFYALEHAHTVTMRTFQGKVSAIPAPTADLAEEVWAYLRDRAQQGDGQAMSLLERLGRR
jgi:hypothetical protein